MIVYQGYDPGRVYHWRRTRNGKQQLRAPTISKFSRASGEVRL
jgi:hypothetical protein